MMCGCKSQKAAVAFADLNGEWIVTELSGADLSGADKPKLAFDTGEKRMSASAGCNNIAGAAELTDGVPSAIRFKGMLSTRKMCIDMSKETALTRALEQVTRFDAGRNAGSPAAFVFYGADNNRLIAIEKQK